MYEYEKKVFFIVGNYMYFIFLVEYLMINNKFFIK